MTRRHRPVVYGLLTLAFAVLIVVAFWPRPLSPMAMTYRAPLYSTKVRGESIDLLTLTELDAEHDASIPVANAIWIGGRNQDLAIVVSGLVGSPEHSLNTFIAQDFAMAGASVMILPSPTQWSFALRRLTEEQRVDYDSSVTAICQAIEEVLDSAPARAAIGSDGLNRIYLTGLSLGARHSISLASCFEQTIPAKELRIFAVNPPVDLLFAGKTIDRLSAGLAANRSRGYAVGILLASLRRLAPWLGVDTALRPLAFFPEALEELAGGSFSARMEQVQTGQAAYLDGITTRRSDFTFLDFVKQGPKTVEDFRREIRSAQQSTKRHLYVLHARDDFLIRPQDLEFLNVELKDHARVLDSGGHGGLLFDPVYREMVAQVISDP